MQEKSLIISLIIALSIVVFLVLIAIFSSMRSKTFVIKKPKSKDTSIQSKQFTIEDMIEIAANRNSTKNDLTNAVMKVAKEFVFPAKIKGKNPKGIKVYLNFVLLLASHKNADAKLIAFNNTELKKVNKEYSTEIDIYENEGLRQRGNRF